MSDAVHPELVTTKILRRAQVVAVEDGTSLELAHFAPAEPPDGGAAVLCLPAMGVSASYYEPFARELALQGLCVATGDLRAHGKSSVRASREVRFGYHEMVTRDVKALVAALRADHPERPLFLLGHSLGGQLGALHLAWNGEEVRGLALVASCSVYYRSYPAAGRLKVLLGSQFVALVAALWGYYPGKRLGFAGNESAGVIGDWARQARTGRYRLAGADIDYESRLAEVEHPLLAITVDGDRLAPPPAVDHLCGKMPRARLTRWHYPQQEAERDGRLDHFRWVRDGAPVARRVKRWVDEVLEAG